MKNTWKWNKVKWSAGSEGGGSLSSQTARQTAGLHHKNITFRERFLQVSTANGVTAQNSKQR